MKNKNSPRIENCNAETREILNFQITSFIIFTGEKQKKIKCLRENLMNPEYTFLHGIQQI